MCNRYSLTKGQAATRDWFRARHDRTGNLPLPVALVASAMREPEEEKVPIGLPLPDIASVHGHRRQLVDAARQGLALRNEGRSVGPRLTLGEKDKHNNSISRVFGASERHLTTFRSGLGVRTYEARGAIATNLQ
jgi:hypothetical protein